MSDSIHTSFPPLFLREGSGETYADGFCVMQAVDWFIGGTGHTDRPECVCPELTAYAIPLNDKLGDEQRQELKKLVAPLVGTRSPEHVPARLRLIVQRTAHEIVAPLFDERFPRYAASIRAANTLQEIDRACRAASAASDHPAAAITALALAASYAGASAAALHAPIAAASDHSVVNYAMGAASYAMAAASYAMVTDGYAGAETDESILAIQISILEEAIWIGPNGGEELAPFASRISELIEYGYA